MHFLLKHMGTTILCRMPLHFITIFSCTSYLGQAEPWKFEPGLPMRPKNSSRSQTLATKAKIPVPVPASRTDFPFKSIENKFSVRIGFLLHQWLVLLLGGVFCLFCLPNWLFVTFVVTTSPNVLCSCLVLSIVETRCFVPIKNQKLKKH